MNRKIQFTMDVFQPNNDKHYAESVNEIYNFEGENGGINFVKGKINQLQNPDCMMTNHQGEQLCIHIVINHLVNDSEKPQDNLNIMKFKGL